MKTTLWIIGVILLVFSGYMIVMNWAVFVNNHVIKKKWTSAIPFVGGIAGTLGLICIPVSGLWRFCWLPILIDWGSVPVVVVALISKIRRSLRV